jgi:hypothetical protein
VSEAISILLPLFLGLIVFLVVMRGVFALVRRKLYEGVRRKFAGQTIIRESIGANFLGQKSKGLGQIRGNGALVLTPTELYFIMFAPRREMSISLDAVTSVSTPRSHLGKTCVAKLLRVDFRSDDGDDAVAWAVRDLDSWTSDIERYKPH